MASNAARIAELEEILRSGVVHDEVDGQITKYDLDAVRSELRKLKARDGRRPVASSINLGGF